MKNDEILHFWNAHADVLTALSLISIVMLVGSVLLVPWLVLRAPHDVFVRERREEASRSFGALLISLFRNVLGGFLIAMGILMLVLPGQGLLTMVVGMCMMDLPRKRELLRNLVKRPPVWRALAWIRHRAGRPPFDAP